MVFATGADGTWLVSTDGGDHWSRLNSGTHSGIGSISFQGGNGYFVDEEGHCHHFTWSTVPVLIPPSVTISSPTNHSTQWACVPLSVKATAIAHGSFVSEVEFFVNGSPLGSSPFAPYAVSWTNEVLGDFTLSAIAHDGLGQIAVSAPVTVSYVLPPLHLMIPGGMVGEAGHRTFKICMTGEKGAVYRVSASTDLIDWTPLGLMSPVDRLFGYQDPDATNYVWRFYRAIQTKKP